jgi:DnaJ-class molecular chaperone
MKPKKPKKLEDKSLEDKIECPNCLGTGEVVDSNEEDVFFSEKCTLCVGEGTISKTSNYIKNIDIFDTEETDENQLDYE